MSSSGLLSEAVVGGSAGDTTITVQATGPGATTSKQFKITKLEKLATRIHKTDLTYVGAFRLPDVGYLGYAGTNGRGAGFTITSRASLFVAGMPGAVGALPVCELAIPTPSTAGSIAALPVAGNGNYIQSWADALNGNGAALMGGAAGELQSIKWAGGSLLVSLGNYYVGDNYRIFKRSETLSATGPIAGPARVTAFGEGSSRLFSGYFADVPAAAQTAYSLRPLMTGGNTGSNGGGDASNGPSGASFAIGDIANNATIAGSGLLYYDYINTGDWSKALPYLFSQPPVGNLIASDHQNKWWGPGTSQCAGCVWINAGSRKVLLFFVVTGMTRPWYGSYLRNGVSGASITTGGVHVNPAGGAYRGDFRLLSIDPITQAQGGHNAPYRPCIIAYDESEVAAVMAGSKQPWQARPYDTWVLDLPFDNGIRGYIHGVDYDRATRRIYVSLQGRDSASVNGVPIVYVLEHPAS